MKERYNRETVVLQTKKGTAKNSEDLRKVWELRVKKYFSHYKVLKVKFEKGKGEEVKI
jgi:hypothetical protein